MQRAIRLATVEDAPRIAQIYSPYCLETAISFELDAPTPEEMAERIKNITRSFPWLVYVIDGQVAGYAYASSHRERPAYRWAADASAYIDKDFHRLGIGRTLYTALFDLLQRQGYYVVHAGITLPNAGSVGLHEAMGFQKVGVFQKVGYKMGKWHDVAWYQLNLLIPGEYPAEPKSIWDVIQEASFRGATDNAVECP